MDAHTVDKQRRLTGEEESEPHEGPSATALSDETDGFSFTGEDFQEDQGEGDFHPERRGEAGNHDKQRRPGPSSPTAADLYARSARSFAPSLSATLNSSCSTTTTMEAWMASQSSPTEDTDAESVLARAIRNASASVAPQPQTQTHLGWSPMGADMNAETGEADVVGAETGASPYGDHSKADKATASELACDKDESSGAATGEETAAASSAQGGSWHPTDGDGPSQLADHDPELAMGGQDAIASSYAVVPYGAPPMPTPYDSAVPLTWALPIPHYFPVHYWAPTPYYAPVPNWASIPYYAPVPNWASSSTHDNGRAAHRGTKLCKYWAKAGACRHGAMCRFAHGHVELRGDDYNKLCRSVLDGVTCPYGQYCRFRHW